MIRDGGRACQLLSKRYTFLFCPQPGGHPEFLTKLAQAPISYAVNYVNVINYKEYQEYQREYQQEYGLTSQDAQDEQYSNPNRKDNSLFTFLLDFERFPFVELRLINAGEIGSRKFFNAHDWPFPLRPYYHSLFFCCQT